MQFSLSPFIIFPVLSLLAGYSLAAVSLFVGRRREENVLLAVVCIWWTLLSWPFICHHLISDRGTLLTIERITHSLFVFNPAFTLLFFQKILKKNNYGFTALSFLFSFIFSILAWTDFYFYGFHEYSWGLIAKSGPAFTAFTTYGSFYTFYIFYLFLSRLSQEKNRIIRLKLKYLFISILASAFMTLTNIPAVCGIDFYPMSNFVFLPLGILTYGLLRYRLMEISSVLHISAIRLILSSVIILPNAGIFIFLRPYFGDANPVIIFASLILWFRLNYTYFNKVQPLINQMFNRRSYNLSLMEKDFIKETSLLMNLDELTSALTAMIKKALSLHEALLFIRAGGENIYTTIQGHSVRPGPQLINLLKQYDSHFEKTFIESHEQTNTGINEMLQIMQNNRCEYLIPFNHGGEVTAILLLSEKKSLKRLNDRELRFVKTIGAYSAVAVSNSVIYENLRELKENLENIVEERTSVIEKQKADIDRDISLAQKIQTALLPQKIPHLDEIDIDYKYVPIMGVGGDFIDIHYREGMKDLGLFICDVSGHGIASALIASMVKMSLNSWGKFIQSPSLAFIEMKDLLRGKIGNNFITACMCSINLEEGILKVSSAGHPPLLICSSEGIIEVVKPRGSLILEGVDSPYEEKSVKLGEGDLIVLYTDGVFEINDTENNSNGEEVLADMLSKHRQLPPSAICEIIYSKICELSGNKGILDDDFALLIAKYSG